MFSCSIKNLLKIPFFFFLFSFFFFTCEKQTTPIETTTISLTAEYVGVTEAELLLVTDTEELPDQYQLFRNGEAVLSGELTDSHTTLWDTTLQPARSYTYRVKLLKQNVTRLLSNELTLTTMDTTSHDFQWEIIEIPSPYGSGILRDVTIINENDIWAVGEIYADSAQPSKRFNAVHWDGSHWELKRVPYVYNGQSYYHPLNFAFSFENGEIWFGGNGIVKWNENSFSNVEIDQNVWGPVAINKMWGSSTDCVFIVGNEGHIAHFNGSSWQKLESGTTTKMQDIWGGQDPRTGEWVIICAASPGYGVSNSGIYKIKENKYVEQIPWIAGRAARSVWFDDPYTIFICGSGIFKRQKSGEWNEIGGVSVIPANTERIRGICSNDIFVVSDFGHIAHFNGLDFKIFNPNSSILYYSCDYLNNLMIAVGGSNNAYITMVRR